MKPQLSVIIVSFNTRDTTLRCLATLFAALDALEAEVFVVDNASSDGSVSAIRAQFPGVHLIKNRENVGFGAANNAAMEQAQGEWFLLLNSDAFPRAGAISHLLEAMQRHPRAGAIGPKLLNGDGSLQRSCWKFPSPGQAWTENLGISALLRGRTHWGDYRRWNHDFERRVDFVAGACLLVKRQVWERIGGFDPAFWMYAEETDWQKRLTRAGYEVWFTPAAEVEHLGGASGLSGDSGADQKARLSEAFFDSLDRYERKHHGLGGLVSLRMAMIAGNLLRAPLWMALWFWPRRRALAREKLRLIVYLVKRQSTRWGAIGGN